MDNFDRFNHYMNQVKADPELKEKTKDYVRTALAEKMRQESQMNSRRIPIWSRFQRKIIITACSAAACALFSIGGYAYYITPVNYISLDINPSVELGINAFDRVISAVGINRDGLNILEGHKLTHMSVEDAISTLIQEATEQNYIKEDGSTVIAVTAESDDEHAAASLQSDCLKGLQSTLDSLDVTAIIYQDAIDLDLRDDAGQMKVSPGKLNLIHYLQQLDPEVTISQYKDSSISEIISDASELLTDNETSGPQFDESEDITDEILDAAEQLQDAREEAQSEQDFDQRDREDEESAPKNSKEQGNSETDRDSSGRDSDGL